MGWDAVRAIGGVVGAGGPEHLFGVVPDHVVDGAKAGDVLQDRGVVDQRVRGAGVVDQDAVPFSLAGGGYGDSVPR